MTSPSIQKIRSIPVAGCIPFFMQVLALAAAPETESLEFFEKKIRPVLAERCFKCHGSKAKGGGLQLDGRAGMLKGGRVALRWCPAGRGRVC